MRYVLDADVLIGALDASDAHHQQSRRLLTAWRAQQDMVLVSLANLLATARHLDAKLASFDPNVQRVAKTDRISTTIA